MANVAIPVPRPSEAVLDRPLLSPSWRRIGALALRSELALYATIVVAGFLLRLWDVGGRAMHHDESLHAYYAWKLFSTGVYTYAPMMHGPLQFEVVPLFYLLMGVSEASARMLAVILGSALIFLPYFLRSSLTRVGAALTALAIAVSPSLVYFSRFIRDDIYLAFFSLVMFIALVKYLESPRSHLLYVAAAAAALAMASMEAAYITFFIFGTFLIVEGIREAMWDREGPVLRAARATSLDTWLTAVSLFAVITVLLYSTFFTNPYGIWDSRHSLCLSGCPGLHPQWNPDRTDILGGVTYWLLQHNVQRGGQPWFYYLLVIPLYEQVALVFGLGGLIFAFVRRRLVTTFLVWWALLALLIYSWAGEKMPWLSIHITLPFLLLAGLALGAVASSRKIWLLVSAGVVFAVLLVLEIHSAFVLNFIDGANPTEMLVYVQTSQDVPKVSQEIAAISHRQTGGNSLPIGLDNADVGGWPFIWYLRDFNNITETASFNGPVCGGQWCPVLLLLEPEYVQSQSQLMSHYVVQRYRWNWWFPEDYKVWFPMHWSAALNGQGPLLANLLGTRDDWSHLWDWLVYRKPFGYRAARELYFLVRRDLVPGARYFSTTPGAKTPTSQPAPQSISAPILASAVLHTFGSAAAGSAHLNGPRGIAADANGRVFVADTLDHRVVSFGPSGASNAWGRSGSGPGQFKAFPDSPLGLGVGPDGKIYVADTWNQRIQVFGADGEFVRQWGGGPVGAGPGQFYGPRSVAVSSTGRVYVADTGNRRIQVFSGLGHYLFSFGTSGSGPGQLQEPSSVAVGPKGNVYVSDFWNQRIQEFTASGQYERSWSVADWQPRTYDEPYLAVDQRSGNVFATDPHGQRVMEYTAAGKLIGSFGVGHLSVPIGIAALPGGRVAVGDAAAGHVLVFQVKNQAVPPSAVQEKGNRRSEQPKKP